MGSLHEKQHDHDREVNNALGMQLIEPSRSNLDDENGRPRLRIQVPGDSQESVTSPKAEAVADSSASTRLTPQVSIPNNHSLGGGGIRFSKSLSFDVGAEKREGSLEKLNRLMKSLLPDFGWIKNNNDATHWKSAIRAAMCAWISVLLLVITRTERLMGQASFLILLAAFLSPPAEPFMQVLERELAILFFVSTTYAWACLGIRLSNLARTEFDLSASQIDIFSGRYIEAWPTVICAVFLFIGTGMLLYMKARVGVGPYTMGLVLSCIVIDISLTTAHLFPYPFYHTGSAVVIPIAFHSAVALLCSIFVFPETVNAQFIKRFRSVFIPLASAMRTQPTIFATNALSDAFNPSPFLVQVEKAEAALGPLAATSRLLKRDLSWGRFGSKDFSRLHEVARRMTVRANGMAFYFKIMDSSKNRQPGTPAFSLLNTPMPSPPTSPPTSRPPSPTRSTRSLNEPVVSSSNASIASASPSTSHPNPHHSSQHNRRRRNRHSAHNSLYHHALNLTHHSHHHTHHSHHHHSRHLHYPSSLFHEVLDRQAEGAVGVFESQRYLNLETRLTHPNAEEIIPRVVAHLGESAADLTATCADALDHLAAWLGRMNQDRFWKLFRRERERTWGEGIQEDEAMCARLRSVLEEFRMKKRHRVLDLYREHVDPHRDLSVQSAEESPPHRYLFQCYLYQFHLMFFSEHLCRMLEDIIELEKTRPRSRLWLPVLPLKQVLMWSKWEPTDVGLQSNEDEDPDLIQGIDPENKELLGQTVQRDPDALPPSNTLEALGTFFHHSASALGHGNAVYGFKAGILSVLLSLPNYLPSSAFFAYTNRSIWALVIGQLTLSRFRGDTAFGWFSRVVATFLGGISGTVLWYISTGLGNGNAYGFAAVCGVVLPFVFFIRLNYPAAPMTLTIYTVTIGLVMGYSWQDATFPTLSTAGIGIEVAWKRFTLVVIGVTVAFIFSYFPPSTTLRRYLRLTYATTAQQLGQAYCDVVSTATAPAGGAEVEALIKALIASRLKLRRSKQLMENTRYEFSLRGRWPRERYESVYEIQLEVAYLLSHLRSVTEHLEPVWTRAFLKRTRFLEPEFQGDVLAVISMISTALRTGSPLPQVTPCPLLDRFVALPSVHKHGLHILRTDENDGEWADEFAGLPRTLTAETLEDEQYLYFSVGVATAFGIVTRLDRLMVAAKELVGEQFHIHGLPVYVSKRGVH